MNTLWYAYFGWIAAAAVLGFAISFVFSQLLHLSRRLYLIPYIGITALFLIMYVRWSGLSISEFIQQNLGWGILAAILLAIFTVKNVLSQPVSARSGGFSLLFDILWSGAIYGSMDALLLSVLPVLATWQAITLLEWNTTWAGKILVGLLAILASLLVTAAYHLGYPEYKGKAIVGPIIGNTAMTLGYLLTANPLAAVLSHIAMHVAGILRGPESVIQLPPHYHS